MFFLDLFSFQRAYEMEQRANTPEKYLFPNYEVLHWYAAKHILDTLKGEKLQLTIKALFQIRTPCII